MEDSFVALVRGCALELERNFPSFQFSFRTGIEISAWIDLLAPLCDNTEYIRKIPDDDQRMVCQNAHILTEHVLRMINGDIAISLRPAATPGQQKSVV